MTSTILLWQWSTITVMMAILSHDDDNNVDDTKWYSETNDCE